MAAPPMGGLFQTTKCSDGKSIIDKVQQYKKSQTAVVPWTRCWANGMFFGV